MTGYRKRHAPIESVGDFPWAKAFYASFGVLCSIIFLAVCTYAFPDASEVIDSPFPGLRQWVGFLDALERIDAIYQWLMFLLPLFSALVTGIRSGILVRTLQRLLQKFS
jgi:hypothetical protein